MLQPLFILFEMIQISLIKEGIFILLMEFYKLISKGYKELYGEEQKIKHNTVKSNLSIKNSDWLLDVGCGTGSDFNCNLVGIDTSIELLQQSENSNRILAAAENMPFKDNVFDKVISISAIHNFNSIKKGIKEINRVGKMDFALSILKKAKNFNLIEKEIKNNFSIRKIVDGKQDWIFICSKVFK
jgi:ubiquinone/menaquinone biosynthesis C-methylase UbiE